MHNLLNHLPTPLDRKQRLRVSVPYIPHFCFNYTKSKSQASFEAASSAVRASESTPETLPSDNHGTSGPSNAMGADNAMDVDADSDNIPLPPVQMLTKSGRPRRNYRIPRRFDDFLPETAAIPDSPPAETGPIQRVLLIVRDHFVSIANTFGIWRDYPRRPARDPDSALRLKDLVEPLPKIAPPSQPASTKPPNSPPWPFANATIHRTMQWLNNGNTVKSENQINEFVNKVILSPDFQQDHFTGFDAHRENIRLDNALDQSSFRAQFCESTIDILVPSGAVGIPSKTFAVPGLLHRKLVAVIADAFSSPLSHLFHFSPFKLYHKSPITAKEERIFGEIYTSDAFLEEHEEVQIHSLLPPDDLECKREKVIAALMFSSDSTHLTNFGTAKAWPIYLMLGNLSKYIRAQPNSGAMLHLAYIPSVSKSAVPQWFLLF